jgi:hypothetical protein
MTSPLTPEMIEDGWIAHDGGPCPVDPDRRPIMIFDNRPFGGDLWKHIPGSFTKEQREWRAGSADWSRCVAYRQEQPSHD